LSNPEGGTAVKAVALIGVVIAAAGCGGGAEQGTLSAGGGLSGVWTHTLVRTQLVATRAPDYLQPKNLKLDVGRYRLVLVNGHATLSKHNAISTFRASGTYTVHGDTIALAWTRAVERDYRDPPDSSCCDPPWRLRWSLYRGALTLQQVQHWSTFEVPPAIWAASWRRGR
jgi:hypothetical protein